MKIAIALYPDFTALDAVGPYEVLARLPGAELVFCASARGPVRTETGVLAITADASFDELQRPDVVLVPGGPGSRALLGENDLIDWLRAVHPGTRWTTSVCTGSLVLAAAGLLAGTQATTHWIAMDLLAQLGADPVQQRVVTAGKIITAAGVSAGIDMALTLAAELASPEVAQALQLSIEYDPDPPFDTGSVAKAPPQMVEFLRAAMQVPVPS